MSIETATVARKQRKHIQTYSIQVGKCVQIWARQQLSKSDLVAIKYTEEMLSELMRTASPTLAKEGECMSVSNCSGGYISARRIPVPMVFN